MVRTCLPAASSSACPKIDQVLCGDVLHRIEPADLDVGGSMLGAGASGKVVKGRWRSQDVAVKMIQMSQGSGANSAEMLAVEREVLVMMKIAGRSRYSCQFHGITSKDGHFCLVMRLYEASLTTVITRAGSGGLPAGKALHYTISLLRALAELHASNVVVCDLKPDNVLIDGVTDDVVMADFGKHERNSLRCPVLCIAPGHSSLFAHTPCLSLYRHLQDRQHQHQLLQDQLASGHRHNELYEPRAVRL